MQIVIDIPKQMYLNAKAGMLCGSDSLVNAIKNGTPLPKRHGRLVDADEVMKVMERNFDMQDLYLPIHFKQFAVDEAQTIIEADKEVDE